MNQYSVLVNGQNIIYDADRKMSHFSDDQWTAIHSEMVRINYPKIYKKYKDDSDVMNAIGWGIDLEERYQLLLELLPQSQYSKPGTHPSWVAQAVNDYIDDICEDSEQDG